MEICVLKNREIRSCIDDVAQLRVTIFREWPYLYEGNMRDEKDYLQMYTDSNESILVLAKEKGQVVGAVTGLPLKDSMSEIKTCFLKEKIPMEGLFYLGEILLLKEFRKQKVGVRMYSEFEKAIAQKEEYKKIFLCEIIREEGDLRKPKSYQSLDPFWNRLGYVKCPNLKISFSYEEIGTKKKTLHPMLFREKTLKHGN